MIVILFGSFLVWLPAGSLVLLIYCVLPLADVIGYVIIIVLLHWYQYQDFFYMWQCTKKVNCETVNIVSNHWHISKTVIMHQKLFIYINISSGHAYIYIYIYVYACPELMLIYINSFWCIITVLEICQWLETILTVSQLTFFVHCHI